VSGRSSTAVEAREHARRAGSFQLWEIVPAAVVLAGFAAWAAAAFAYGRPLDFGLAYRAGVAAWDTGHPEQLRTWMSTPFLGMVMALVSRAVSLRTGIGAVTALNVGLTAVLLAVVWRRLRPEVPRAAWWATLGLAAVFAPMVSTALFKQFNLVVLALGMAGFAAVRRGRNSAGGALTALALCLKPIAVLTPFAFLAWRDTRKAGVWTIVWAAAFTAAAQAFLAWRAGNPAALDPFPAFLNFSKRTAPWVCHEENFSPRGTLCRVAGDEAWEPGAFIVLAGVLLLAAMARNALDRHPGRSWEAFAFVSLVSPMVGPIAWTHYQLFLAPMLVLLAVRFATTGAHWTLWGGLVFAFFLSALVVRPIGTVPGGLAYLFGGRDTETLQDAFRVMAVSQLAQYFLFLTAYAALRERRHA